MIHEPSYLLYHYLQLLNIETSAHWLIKMLYNRILFSHKKWNCAICSKGGFQGHLLSEISQIEINAVWSFLYLECKKKKPS